MIVLFSLLGIILVRDFDVISFKHFIAALITWTIAVVVLQVWEGCRLRGAMVPPEQPETFCCMHCAERKPVEERSTAINRMCQGCADLYETIQDEV